MVMSKQEKKCRKKRRNYRRKKYLKDHPEPLVFSFDRLVRKEEENKWDAWKKKYEEAESRYFANPRKDGDEI